MTDVVTVFVRNRGALLLVRRRDGVESFQGRWAGVSGFVRGDVDRTRTDAERELAEEVGIHDPEFVRGGEPLRVVDEAEREWTVHPFLVEVPERTVGSNRESQGYEWVAPPAMLDRETVPGLWRAYRRVAPTVETVARDESHGSAYVSARALEVLRDVAAEAAHATDLAAPEFTALADVCAVARRLRGTRPAMAAVANRVNRAMVGASDPAELAERAHEALLSALDADEDAAARAAELLADRGDATVVTLSRSGTVLAALRDARSPSTVTVAESRPAREGVDVAEDLADGGFDVTLTTDANLPAVVAGDGTAPTPDVALVGADTVLADGDVVNKVGTRALGLACAREGVPLYVVAARDKVSPADAFENEHGDEADLYDGPTDLAVANPIFDRTPADCVAAVVTEDGPLDLAAVREVAEKHREHAKWDAERN